MMVVYVGFRKSARRFLKILLDKGFGFE